MVVQIDILYRNGVKDRFELKNVSEYELTHFKELVKLGLGGSNSSGYLELDDCIIIRFSDVLRVRIKEIGEVKLR